MIIRSSYSNTPVWRDIYVHAILPEKLQFLDEMAHNLWWVWNGKAKSVFKRLDPEGWRKNHQNPVALLQNLTTERIEEILNDTEFFEEAHEAYRVFKDYMSKPYDTTRPSVAYFSMEYGLTHVLKIYSGGLGVLAGDYLKEASDSCVDLTGVGFLYRYGYFSQSLSVDGQQIANYEAQNFGTLPIIQVTDEKNNPLILEVPFHDKIVYCHIWKVAIGRINLYLMDTDIDLNDEFYRSITYNLYGGIEKATLS
jgi:starch phosphorylase